MIWFLRRRNAAEEARKGSKARGAQQSQQSSSSDDWSMNPANPMSSTLNPMHAAGNSPSNDQVPSPDCPPSHDSRNYDTGSSGFTDGGNSCGDSGGGGGSSFDSGGGSN
jgi:hypothetical protein